MIGIGNISLAGKSLRDFGVKYALLKNRYAQPEPAVDSQHIAGRNGDVLFYTGEFQNVDLNYLCICEGDFDTNFSGLKSWLYSHRGYMRLEDDSDPDIYRLGAVLNETTISDHRDCFELTINCRPQKFLRTGEIPVRFSQSGNLFNPTEYAAMPLLKITGTGRIVIGSTAIDIVKNTSYMMMDCEIMDCYRGAENLNSDVELATGDFFTLESGTNQITLASGMTVEVTPRFWRL